MTFGDRGCRGKPGWEKLDGLRLADVIMSLKCSYATVLVPPGTGEDLCSNPTLNGRVTLGKALHLPALIWLSAKQRWPSTPSKAAGRLTLHVAGTQKVCPLLTDSFKRGLMGSHGLNHPLKGIVG